MPRGPKGQKRPADVVVPRAHKRRSTATFTGRTASEVELKLLRWIEAHPNATIVKETQTKERSGKPTGLEGTRPGGGMVTNLHIEFTE